MNPRIVQDIGMGLARYIFGHKWLAGMALSATAMLAYPALADVKEGVDAWSRGDYAAAVKQWEGPARAGDADAMFNLGQAYRLGRGVPTDLKRAESFYARAAAAGHLQAADTYGLLLFQDGRREAALPYVEDAARRGDPRSQYLLGVAHFNGDIVQRDVVRAYALVTMANSAGLPQAASAVRQMDQAIPLAQRQQAVALAMQLEQEASAARERELAAAELAADAPLPGTRPVASPTMRPPQTLATTAVSPSVSSARAAVNAARSATGDDSPAEAGASFARGGAGYAAPSRPVEVAALPQRTPARSPAAQPAARPAPQAAAAPARVARPAPRPAAAAASGPWRVQLGAFSVAGNADKLWQQLSRRPELAGRQKLAIPAGRVTKLQAGGFASRSAAEAACRALSASGQDCLVTDR